KRFLYVADMRLAFRAWEASQLELMEELLQSQVPRPGQLDLRSWEWDYLQALRHRELATLPPRARLMALSPDGLRLATVAMEPKKAGENRQETGKVCDLGTIGGAVPIKVWDALTGRELFTLPGHRG